MIRGKPQCIDGHGIAIQCSALRRPHCLSYTVTPEPSDTLKKIVLQHFWVKVSHG
jgi:hypothetical protein